MSAGYVIATENFKEAGRHVSAEADPVMFNLLYGLLSLTSQIEADFALLRGTLAAAPAQPPKKTARKAQVAKSGAKNKKSKKKATRRAR